MNPTKINENFQINLLDLIPTEWYVENLDNHIRVSYQTKGRGNNPKPFILPRMLILDKEFIEGISMYIGDGKLSKDLGHLEFTSKDKDMIKFMLDFFKNKFNIRDKDFMFRR